MILQIKGLIYGLLLSATVIGIGYILNEWHYNPIAVLERKVKSLESVLEETGRQLNVCEANLSKQSLTGYIDGIGDSNEEPVIDFSDIVY